MNIVIENNINSPLIDVFVSNYELYEIIMVIKKAIALGSASLCLSGIDICVLVKNNGLILDFQKSKLFISGRKDKLIIFKDNLTKFYDDKTPSYHEDVYEGHFYLDKSSMSIVFTKCNYINN